MIKYCFAFVLSIGAVASMASAQATTQPAAMAAMTSTTQPAAAGKGETFGEIFGRTRVGQLFEGKQKVTLEDVKDPAFWIDTVRDLILAILGFIPRLIVAGLFLLFFWTVYR